jgi:peptidoglycan/xylan/chitin deacetylase (PgdA/CDA1 family)
MSHFLRGAADSARMAAIGYALNLLGLPAIRRRALEGLEHAGMILMFHHVAPPSPERLPMNQGLEITPQTLDRVLCSLKAQDHDIVSLDEALERLALGARGKRRFAALTFDDGGRDNLRHAAPVLLRHGAPFTIFVTTGFASGRVAPWWHAVERAVLTTTSLTIKTESGLQRFDTSSRLKKVLASEALRDILWRASETVRTQQTNALAMQAGLDLRVLTNELFMDWDDISAIAALPGCTIGSHTATHPKLAELNEHAAIREISEGRDTIRDRLRVEVKHFSYPFGGPGACEEREFAMARAAGFATAVTSRRGVLTNANLTGLTSLPRVPINGWYQQPAMIDALVSGLPMALATRASQKNVSSCRSGALEGKAASQSW